MKKIHERAIFVVTVTLTDNVAFDIIFGFRLKEFKLKNAVSILGNMIKSLASQDKAVKDEGVIEERKNSEQAVVSE